jgi:hypothetical protein
MLFAAFGDAVQQDPWAYAIGAAILWLGQWLGPKIPAVANLIALVKWLMSMVPQQPTPLPVPVDPSQPSPMPVPDNQGPLADLIRLLLEALRKKQVKAAEDLATKLTAALDEK